VKWEGETGSCGNNSRQLEFGLGDEDAIDRIEIDWPGADTETIEDVPVDSVVSIREGEGIVYSQPLEPITMKGSEGDGR